MVDQWKTIEKYAYCGIAVILFILVVVSSISYQSLVHIQNDFNWVTNTRETLLDLSSFLSRVKDAEMGQRSYLLTGEDQYLEPYKFVEKGIKSHFRSLRVIALGNTVQQKRLDVFEELVTKKLVELEKLIDLQKDKGTKAASEAMMTGTGKKIMDDIQLLVLDMTEDERSLLQQRSQSTNARIKMDAVIKVAGIILILVTVILVMSRISYLVAMYKKAIKKEIEFITLKSNFISSVSHELRTPLKAVRESISIVLDGSAGQINDEQKKFLSVSKRNVDRLTNLIDDFLDLQKLDSDKMSLYSDDNDMNQAVKEVYELMLPPAEKKSLSLTMELDESLPKIKFDKDKIIQVLTNIIDNAVKFTQTGTVTVATRRNGNALIVSVKDTGPGIAEEDLPKLFNEFEQLPNASGKRNRGTGLGLAICKGIIHRHRGKIWAESELGKGTIMQFILPVVEHRA